MKRFFVLICFLLIAPSVVIISCITATARVHGDQDPVSINTGPEHSGLVYTRQVIDRIDAIVVFDSLDRSRRIELEPSQWQYDPVTTQVTIHRDIPFLQPLYHIEGVSERPQRFVLNNCANNEKPLVFIDGRIALESADYTWNEETKLLSFLNRITIDAPGFYVDYSTPEGSACFGSRGDEKSADSIEYYLSQKRREKVIRELEENRDYPFLLAQVSGPPTIVMRKLQEDEKAEMLAQSTLVIKARRKSDSEISKEVGFSVHMPKKVLLSPSGTYALSGVKMIIETVTSNGTMVSVSSFYQFSDVPYGTGTDSVELKVSNKNATFAESENDFLIEKTTLPAIPSIEKNVSWGITNTDTGFTSIPVVTYHGVCRGVYVTVTCKDDESICNRVEAILLAFASQRE